MCLVSNYKCHKFSQFLVLSNFFFLDVHTFEFFITNKNRNNTN